jgi:hypothetical protein
MFRDYWVRVAWTGALYTVDVYATQDDANNAVSRLAYGTCGAGDNSVTMTVDGAAAFNPTPMTVVLTTVGTFTSSIHGWVSGLQAELLTRIEYLLSQYAGPNETLNGMHYAGIGLGLPAILPAYGVRPGRQQVSREHRDLFIADCAVELYAAAESMDDPSVIHECVEWCEKLRSIALDEQQTWGGFATTTTTTGMEMARSEVNGLVVYEANLPLIITVAGLYTDRAPGTEPSSGGKYAAGL